MRIDCTTVPSLNSFKNLEIYTGSTRSDMVAVFNAQKNILRDYSQNIRKDERMCVTVHCIILKAILEKLVISATKVNLI